MDGAQFSLLDARELLHQARLQRKVFCGEHREVIQGGVENAETKSFPLAILFTVHVAVAEAWEPGHMGAGYTRA